MPAAWMMKGSLVALPRGKICFCCGQLYSSRSGQLLVSAEVNVGFFHGATLPDPARLLQGTGKFMRHVKLRPGTATNATALNALINAAYSDIKTRVENG